MTTPRPEFQGLIEALETRVKQVEQQVAQLESLLATTAVNQICDHLMSQVYKEVMGGTYLSQEGRNYQEDEDS